MGAQKLTSNTAELQAITEALLLLLAQVNEEFPLIPLEASSVFYSESRYAVDAILRGTRGKRTPCSETLCCTYGKEHV